MLPFARRCHDIEFIFQQNNASIHSSYKVTEWFKSTSSDFEDEEMCVMDWPSKSPDLSHIEIYGASWHIWFTIMGVSLTPSMS